jgi:hypothetical protein
MALQKRHFIFSIFLNAGWVFFISISINYAYYFVFGAIVKEAIH